MTGTGVVRVGVHVGAPAYVRDSDSAAAAAGRPGARSRTLRSPRRAAAAAEPPGDYDYLVANGRAGASTLFRGCCGWPGIGRDGIG